MTMMYVLGRGVQEAGEPQWVQRHHGRAVGAAGGAVRQQRQGELWLEQSWSRDLGTHLWLVQLLSENSELSAHMSKLLEEAQAREKQFTTQQTELTLQLKLVEAQLKKAQLEKAEVKCEMTQERMEITQELNLERDRSINLERTVNLLREQLEVYEVSWGTFI